MLRVKKNEKISNFNQIFDLSTGFCTTEYWNELITMNYFALCHEIYDENYCDGKFIDFNFDFEKINFTLIKRFKHFSLFSICLHFLRCVRCCRVCSRLCGGYFYDCNSFWNLHVGKVGSDLGFYNNVRIDFNVFCIMLVKS